MLLKEVIEALVFASQKPLSIKEILAALRAAMDDNDEDEGVRALAKTKEAEVAVQLEELRIDYIRTNRAFQLVEQASGWAIVTKPEFGIWVRQLYPESKPTRLSGPALETLAIIAYRQPITRADIEAVRGVAVDGVMQSLLDRSLVRIAGRAEIPGRPLLYETTQVFMEHFGLRSLVELPNSDELRRVTLPSAPAGEEAKEAKEGKKPKKTGERKPETGEKEEGSEPVAPPEASEGAEENQNPAPAESVADAAPEPVQTPQTEEETSQPG